MYTLSDYDYTLPPELIAQKPADPADSCKFLMYDQTTQQITDRTFSDLPDLIDPSTLIVFNTSKVLKARLLLPQDQEPTNSPLVKGGKTLQSKAEQGQGDLDEASQLSKNHSNPLEIFYLHSHSPYTFEALVRPGKKFKVGTTITLDNEITFTVDAITEEGRLLTCSHPILEVLEQYGQMPLPPYISYDETKADPYQPIFAKEAGSVAAPTASLHFTPDLLQRLADKGVTTTETVLHVGLGTFKQVDTEDITSYQIHSEQLQVTYTLFDQIAVAKRTNQPILAVGTTVTRTLETLPYLWKQISSEEKQKNWSSTTIAFWDDLTQQISDKQASTFAKNISLTSHHILLDSQLYIYPGFQFRVIDQLITNFHLPKSSLLMLVAGFMGYEEMKRLYDHAIAHQYRFYSFGDAMWCR